MAVIVPDKETLFNYAKSRQMGDVSYEDLCADDSVRKHILHQLIAFGKANDLKGFENVKNIKLEHVHFSLDNNLLTPTFKLKRFEAKVWFLCAKTLGLL